MDGEIVRLRCAGPTDLWSLSASAIIATGGCVAAGFGLARNSVPALAFGAGSVLCAVLVSLSPAVRSLRRIALTPAELRIPRGFRTGRFPVSEIAGVGLLYWARATGGRGPLEGWMLAIWTGDGTRHDIRQVALATRPDLPPPPGHRELGWGARRPREWPLPFEQQPAGLAATRPGRIAARIHDYVLARQGADGPLATRALQTTQRPDRWADPEAIAYYDPAGTLARIR